ncbi:hypothetical protein R6Z07F_006488 [Ovis aries]
MNKKLLSCVQLFANPWTAACQASLFITNSQSLLKLMSMESVMPSNHLILCHPLLLPSIFPSTRVFSNESDTEAGQAPGVDDGQGSLACCSAWGRKELDTTERLS